MIPPERFYGPKRPQPPPPPPPRPQPGASPPAAQPPTSPVKIPKVVQPTLITREQRETIKAAGVSLSRAMSRHLCSRAAAKHSGMMYATVKVDNINVFTARCVVAA